MTSIFYSCEFHPCELIRTISFSHLLKKWIGTLIFNNKKKKIQRIIPKQNTHKKRVTQDVTDVWSVTGNIIFSAPFVWSCFIALLIYTKNSSKYVNWWKQKRVTGVKNMCALKKYKKYRSQISKKRQSPKGAHIKTKNKNQGLHHHKKCLLQCHWFSPWP